MLNKKQRNIGLLAGLIAVFLPVVFIEVSVARHTGGNFIYPVDDTFIHLELAKNLANHGTWGINSNEFGSASSSLLYTVLLGALSKIIVSNVLLPFIVDCLAVILLIVMINNWLARQGLSTTAIVLINLIIVFFTPLPILTISGMEHILQCLFCFWFLFYSCNWMEKIKTFPETRFGWNIPLAALLVTATRYEGLFLVALVCLAFLFYRQYAAALKTGSIALLPVIIFGLYSLSKGGYFLPNSVLIKGNEASLFDGGIGHFFETLLVDKLTFSKAGITAMATQRLLLILPITYILFLRQPAARPSYRLMLILLFGCVLLHLSLAATGKFYRYEAYLILCSALIVSTVIFKHSKESLQFRWNGQSILLEFLFFFLLFPLFLRSAAAFSKATRACINIYEQQYQMGQFLKTYYPTTAIAANDIGAVSYYTRGPILDLWGLGSTTIAESRRNKKWNPAFLDSLCNERKIQLAVIYDSWFQNGFENRWKKIAAWQIPDNVVCGDDTVSFYAIDSAIAPRLKQDLLDYQKRLPAEVKVQYY